MAGPSLQSVPEPRGAQDPEKLWDWYRAGPTLSALLFTRGLEATESPGQSWTGLLDYQSFCL